MIRFLIACVAAVTLSGCATVNKTAFNREAANNVQAIAVTQSPNQQQYEAAVIGHVGTSFGLIGGLIAAADIQAKTNRFTQAIDPARTKLQERFAQMLAQELTSAGYTTTLMPIDQDATEPKILEQARGVSGKQAVLHTQVVGGYWAAGHATNYVPRVFLKARLVDLKTGAVLFEDMFTYGYANPVMKSVHIAADSRFSYANIDALSGSPEAAREGLFHGLQALARQIAVDLKRQ